MQGPLNSLVAESFQRIYFSGSLYGYPAGKQSYSKEQCSHNDESERIAWLHSIKKRSQCPRQEDGECCAGQYATRYQAKTFTEDQPANILLLRTQRAANRQFATS